MRKLFVAFIMSSVVHCSAYAETKSIEECIEIMDIMVYGDYTPNSEKVSLLVETALLRIVIQDKLGMERDMEYLYLLCEKYPECRYELDHMLR